MSFIPGGPGRAPFVTRAGALILAIGIGIAGYQIGVRTGGASNASVSGSIDLSRFNQVLQIVLDQHVGEKVDQQLIDGAIKGLVNALDDPYSVYLTTDEMQAMIDGLSGSFEGIGAVIETRTVAGDPCTTISLDCQLIVVSPIDGSPAAKADIRSGDRITAVDGNDLIGESVDTAIPYVRGPKGTTVVLTIVRGQSAPQDVSIVRDTISVPAVQTKSFTTSGGAPVGYIRLSEFSQVAGDQLHAALQKIVNAGTTRIVLDLRDNPGGYLSTALHIASEFIGDGLVYQEEDSRGNRSTTAAQPGGLATDSSIRLVVLVNGGSASASEILAGALQDRERAVLVGETTFGKGVVQTFMDIPGGYGLKLTIAKWLTPNGTWIHKVGITPEYLVAPAKAGSSNDPQLAKALDLLK
jgi:carboxyl-terminal processing protease